MSETVQIGECTVGAGHRAMIVAEIGINHNGSPEIARNLIAAAARAGCQAVKFQKRTVDLVYTPAELAAARTSPLGTTNGALKHGLEFDCATYGDLNAYCQDFWSMPWFASCWDERAVDDLLPFDPPCWKIASASLTDADLLRHHRHVSNKPIILSTGMSTLREIDRAVDILGTRNLILLHCTSTYPADLNEINLRAIPMLQARYDTPVGFSDHFHGLCTSLAAVTLGACMIEKHITLSRSMWGSDQSTAVEPRGLTKLVQDIRAIERAMGDALKHVHESEELIKAKLRRKDTLYDYANESQIPAV